MKRAVERPGARGTWPAPQRTHVRYLPGERAAFRRIAGRLFGDGLAPQDWAGLAGTPDGAVLELGTLERRLYLEFHDPRQARYFAVRLIEPGPCGPLLIDDGLRIRCRRLRAKGFGLQILARQLRAARRWGVMHLKLEAGRNATENGYYTWPRLGFDGPLPEALRRQLPAEHRWAGTILELMRTPAGRAWWRAHGATLTLTFDLDPAGPCWQAFQRYLRQRRAGGGKSRDQPSS